MPHAHGPFKIVQKINDNAYILDLPPEYGVSSSFNVVDLRPYVGEDEQIPSRMTPIQEGLDDEDIHAQATTTPEVIQGPVTRARARELNYVLLLSNQGPAEG